MGYKIVRRVLYELWEIPQGPFDQPLGTSDSLKRVREEKRKYEKADKEAERDK